MGFAVVLWLISMFKWKKAIYNVHIVRFISVLVGLQGTVKNLLVDLRVPTGFVGSSPVFYCRVPHLTYFLKVTALESNAFARCRHRCHR
jgi:hypothetical protein